MKELFIYDKIYHIKAKKGVFMKKIINKINMFVIAMMVSVPAFAATNSSGATDAMCKLMEEMGGIFSTLRVLAFAGAAFTIAGWAWGFIKDGKGIDLDDVRKKGTGLLVGFILLFGIGTVLSVLMSVYGDTSVACAGILQKW